MISEICVAQPLDGARKLSKFRLQAEQVIGSQPCDVAVLQALQLASRCCKLRSGDARQRCS